MSAEKRNRGRILLSLVLLCGVLLLTPTAGFAVEKVVVLFAVHGGFDQYSRQHLFDTSIQMFSY